MHICVYCGSRVGHNATYATAAHDLGIAFATRGWSLVYGGGNVGLMGVLARSTLSAGGKVIGIIPQALLDQELALTDCSELIVTETLRQRKALMDTHSHVFMALPGGYGTFEELIETLTLRQLGYHNKPILILNLDNYYDPLLSLFEHALEAGFVSPEQMHLYNVVTSVDEALNFLMSYAIEQEQNHG